MKIKQLFCKHKRARVINTRTVETNPKKGTAICIITYSCPECGKMFEREHGCVLPRGFKDEI